MDSEELMKRSAVVLAGVILLAGCHKADASKEKLLRRALADTNVALGEAQDRAKSYQVAYERLVHEKVKQKRAARRKVR